MSQKQRLLDFLKKYGKINPLQAWRDLGIYRLSDTVLQLRKEGHDIETTKIEVKNKFDEDCKVAEYRIRGWL